MKKNALIVILAVVAVIAVLAISIIWVSNRSRTTATPTTNPNLIYTAAAQTADARLTQIFRSTPSATPTTPVTPTPTFDAVQTLAAQTASALLTQAAGLTATAQGTATSTPIPTGAGPSGDRSVFVSETIPDGTVLTPGAAFTKTWRLQNAGTSTWTTSYSLVFVSGEQMGSITSVPLPQSIAPGAQVDISVNLVAPTNLGTYQGYWKLKNASGQFFNDTVYVLIAVGNVGATPTATSGTPVATPSLTSTGIPVNPITNLTMAVDQGTYDGPCPHTFAFSATFTLSQGATLTYKLEASSDTPGFVFVLPNPQTSTFGPGTYTLPFSLIFTSSGSGLVWLHISAPVDTSSNQVAFNLTCQP